MWGHTRRNCYHEHSELHPANRAWVNKQMAFLGQQHVQHEEQGTPLQVPVGIQNHEANVMTEKKDRELTMCMVENNMEEEQEDHPFELNMVMEEGQPEEDEDEEGMKSWRECIHQVEHRGERRDGSSKTQGEWEQRMGLLELWIYAGQEDPKALWELLWD